jgi:hypothetical protein
MTDKFHVAPDSLIICCSGALKVGVLLFQRSGWPQEGFGAFSCIAGIGSRNPTMIRKAYVMVTEFLELTGLKSLTSKTVTLRPLLRKLNEPAGVLVKNEDGFS